MSTENTPSLLPNNNEFQMFQTIARAAQNSGLYAGVGQESKIFMILLAAREIGISPMLALNGGIWNIQGKIEISARLMNSLVRRAGHSIKVIESTDTTCTLLGKRTDGDSFECTFSMEDAIKAGLAGGNVWKKYPSDMLYNRCMSRLARRLFSDVIGTAYVEGEISEARSAEKLPLAESEDVTSRYVPEPEPKPSPPVNEPSSPPPLQKIDMDQLTELELLLERTEDTFKENFLQNIKKHFGVDNLHDLTTNYYKSACNACNLNIKAKSSNKQSEKDVK